MARPQKNQLAARDFHKHVLRLQKRKPCTVKDVELWAYGRYGARISIESIRKAFAGDADPTACAAEVLLVIAAFFAAEPDALGPYAAERLQGILAMAADVDGAGDLGISASGWFHPKAA